MVAASTSKTSVKFYQTTQRNIPEDSHIHALRRENLKSHVVTAELAPYFMTKFPEKTPESISISIQLAVKILHKRKHKL
jgi:hypothetical protein